MSPFMQAIIGMTLFAVTDFLMDLLTQRRYAKKCGYNCKACRNWKCYKHYCDRKREGN